MDDSMDPSDQLPPDVTISSADNGHVVRWHQRSKKRGEPGREMKRVASTKEEALGHADEALGGGGSTKSSKKRSISRDGHGSPDAGDESASPSPAAHGHARHRSSTRRRRPRPGRRA